MKKRNIFVCTGLALIAGVAFAGAQNSLPVEINFDFGFAAGDQYSARTAKNDVERIGCGARRSANGFEWGFCSAADADGNFTTCATLDPVLRDEMGAIGEFGYVSFNWDISDPTTCTSVRWSKQSQYLPNFTTKGSK